MLNRRRNHLPSGRWKIQGEEYTPKIKYALLQAESQQKTLYITKGLEPIECRGSGPTRTTEGQENHYPSAKQKKRHSRIRHQTLWEQNRSTTTRTWIPTNNHQSNDATTSKLTWVKPIVRLMSTIGIPKSSMKKRQAAALVQHVKAI